MMKSRVVLTPTGSTEAAKVAVIVGGATIVVGSFAVLLELLVSPPPETTLRQSRLLVPDHRDEFPASAPPSNIESP